MKFLRRQRQIQKDKKRKKVKGTKRGSVPVVLRSIPKNFIERLSREKNRERIRRSVSSDSLIKFLCLVLYSGVIKGNTKSFTGLQK